MTSLQVVALSLMEAPSIDSLKLDTFETVAGKHFEKNHYPHAEWSYLRKRAPVYWYGRKKVVPFWAITKHADISEVARQPRIFLNAPRLDPPAGKSPHAVRAPRETEGIALSRRIQRCASA